MTRKLTIGGPVARHAALAPGSLSFGRDGVSLTAASHPNTLADSIPAGWTSIRAIMVKTATGYSWEPCPRADFAAWQSDSLIPKAKP